MILLVLELQLMLTADRKLFDAVRCKLCSLLAASHICFRNRPLTD
jgi:hypothetical protein